jgi:chemotaxis protein CheZ
VPGEFKEELINCTTKIYEACNFQDITGQRITKVVMTLKHIDTKVGALLTALGDELGPTKIGDDTMVQQPPHDNPASLLNGPQLPGRGVDQDHIDRLLEKE